MLSIRFGALAATCAFLSACGTSSQSGPDTNATTGNSAGATTSGTGATGSTASGGTTAAATTGTTSGATASGDTAGSGASSSGTSVSATSSGGSNGSSSGGTNGASGGGTNGASGGGTTGDAGASPLPRLTVNGNALKDPTGKTIVLRGSSLIDIGSLYAYGGMNASGITSRMDKIATAGVQGHVVRLPVYPEITYNGGTPTCSPIPYPVGTGPSATCTPKMPMSADDYVAKLLKPAVDYAASKGMYAIIDYHQIDNATTGTSAADATTFWTDIAPKFASYTNVLFEPFNEPIDNMTTWAALKPVVQGFIDTIRAGAPDNVIIVPSNSWDQRPGDAASDPPNGTNLVYTAHIYPNNWKQGFQTQVSTAVAKAPVFVSEWGYNATDPANWGTSLQTTLDGNGASWTAWVTDNAWAPPMFSNMALTQLTGFGTLVQSWLSAKANSDWVQ